MADSTIPLMKAVVTALSGVCSGRVYGEVPTNPTYPYAVVSGEQVPFDAADLDGMTHTIRVQIFSRSGKPVQCLEEREKVYNALHKASLTITGHTLVDMLYTMSDHFKEEDGKTWQSVIEFSATVE